MKFLTTALIIVFSVTAQASRTQTCDFLYKEYGKLRSILDWSKELPSDEKTEFLQTTTYDDLITSIATFQTLISGSQCRISSPNVALTAVDESISFSRSISEAIRRASMNNDILRRGLPINENPVLEHISLENKN